MSQETNSCGDEAKDRHAPFIIWLDRLRRHRHWYTYLEGSLGRSAKTSLGRQSTNHLANDPVPRRADDWTGQCDIVRGHVVPEGRCEAKQRESFACTWI